MYIYIYIFVFTYTFGFVSDYLISVKNNFQTRLTVFVLSASAIRVDWIL